LLEYQVVSEALLDRFLLVRMEWGDGFEGNCSSRLKSGRNCNYWVEGSKRPISCVRLRGVQVTAPSGETAGLRSGVRSNGEAI
jgi:hypothetical protein